MPRFFFDIRCGDLIRDEDGVECSDLREIERRAKQLIPKVLDNITRSQSNYLDFRVFVRDQFGQIIYMSALIYNASWADVRIPESHTHSSLGNYP